MSITLTYSQVQEALSQGFVSPLNSKEKTPSSCVGEVFVFGSKQGESLQWEVTRVDNLDGLDALKDELQENGKTPAWFYARRVLKSGRASKQSGMFYRFSESGNYVKVM